MGECKDGHIPTCMLDNNLSHILVFWPPLFHMEVLGQEMFQGIGGSFIDVGELYFASPDWLVHGSLSLVRSFPKPYCPIGAFVCAAHLYHASPFQCDLSYASLNNLIIVKLRDLK